jgi:HEPN domain-containing protein
MIDIGKQVNHWRKSAIEDLDVAEDLILNRHRVLHGLFFVHLALEKLLKALVCQKTQKLAPYIHNLIRLSEIADLHLDPQHKTLLADVNDFNLSGRYPDLLVSKPSLPEARQYLKRAKGTFEWLKNQL